MHSALSGPVVPPLIPATPGQLVIVERLRLKGVKKRSAPEHGYLVLEQLAIPPEILHRPAGSSATLYRSADRLMGSSTPLFDPQIIRWDSAGLVLQGWESSADRAQYRQVWLVTFPSQPSAIRRSQKLYKIYRVELGYCNGPVQTSAQNCTESLL